MQSNTKCADILKLFSKYHIFVSRVLLVETEQDRLNLKTYAEENYNESYVINILLCLFSSSFNST